MKNIYKIISFVALIIIVDSCVPSKPVYEEEILPADRLVKRLEANRRKIKTFQGNGVINVESPKLDAKASFEVYLKKPDSLKFEIYGPFGITLAQAIVSGSEFMFYNVMENVVYKGRNGNNILKKIFHIDLSFSELVDAFAGGVNLTSKLREEPNFFNLDDDDYYLTYQDSTTNLKSEYIIQIDNLAIKNYKLYKNNNILLFEGIYSSFEFMDRVAIPYTTIVQNKIEKQKVTIDYRNIEVNETLDDLSIDIPADAKVKIL